MEYLRTIFRRTGLHMSGIPEINATLISTLIAAVLQTNHTLSSP